MVEFIQDDESCSFVVRMARDEKIEYDYALELDSAIHWWI